MGSESQGLSEDTQRRSETVGEHQRKSENEGWGRVRTRSVLSQASQANLGELQSENAEGRRKRESLWRNPNYNRAERLKILLERQSPDHR